MTIPYILGIPDANHSPSVDQPDMRDNNDHIADIIAVDHCGFGVNSPERSGEHLHVTFPAAQSDPALVQIQTQLYPKSFGTGTTLLETYTAARMSNSDQINGYLPFVKCMGRFTGIASPFGPITAPNNTIYVNIASIVQSTNIRPGDTITVNFTTDLPYTNYYIFFEDHSTFNISITKNLSSMVFRTAGILTGFTGLTLGFMVV